MKAFNLKLPLSAVLLGLSICWLGNQGASAYSQGGLEVAKQSNSSLVAATPAKVEEFTAVGTEPFWSVKVSRSGIVYSSPDVKSRKYPYIAPKAASNRPLDLLRVYQLKGQTSGFLVIKKGTCSDGMSDRVYPYDATVILGNQVLEGCAYKK
ncbi:MAG: hypothetical protein WBB28_00090 [Crinalium sp.]